MTTTTLDQDSPQWASFRKLFWTVAAILAALLALLWLMGFGPGGSQCKALMAAAAPAAAVAPPVAPAIAAPAAPVAAAPAAATPAMSVPPPAKVYFGLDKTDLPGDVQTTLADVAAYLKANANGKASISGFHDPSGSQARNEELAKNRALAVRGALEQAGVAKDRIVMEKPQVTTGTGEAQEARRVEVTVVL
jgi:outer membrane protein OmpA-like peptidoglycan-associated protein